MNKLNNIKKNSLNYKTSFKLKKYKQNKKINLNIELLLNQMLIGKKNFVKDGNGLMKNLNGIQILLLHN